MSLIIIFVNECINLILFTMKMMIIRSFAIVALSITGVLIYGNLFAFEKQTGSTSQDTCEASVSYSPNPANDYVRCSGNSCKRNAAEK